MQVPRHANDETNTAALRARGALGGADAAGKAAEVPACPMAEAPGTALKQTFVIESRPRAGAFLGDGSDRIGGGRLHDAFDAPIADQDQKTPCLCRRIFTRDARPCAHGPVAGCTRRLADSRSERVDHSRAIRAPEGRRHTALGARGEQVRMVLDPDPARPVSPERWAWRACR
jgi:hypothetical protein